MARVSKGVWKAYRETWDSYEIDRILDRINPKELGFELRYVCFYMALGHLL